MLRNTWRIVAHDCANPKSDAIQSIGKSALIIGSCSVLQLSFTVLRASKKTLIASGSISSSTQSIHSLVSMPGDMTQVDGRVGRWALGFDKLMEDPAGLGCFKVRQFPFFIPEFYTGAKPVGS